MRTNTFLLFFLCLFFIASCSDNEIKPGFSIQTTGDITIAYEAESQATIHFTSSCEWQASSADNWFTISPSSGKGGTFDLVVTAKTENITANPRKATIMLTSGGLTKDIVLEQSNAVTLEQDTYNVDDKEKDIDIQFTTNVATDEVKFYSDAAYGDWWGGHLEVLSSSSMVLKLTVFTNFGTSDRTTNIYIVREAGTDKKVLATATINQKGAILGESVDYSADKTAKVLQRHTQGSGIPIVIMGDGFLDKDIADGTYGKVMEKALENLFTEEPMKSLRSYFNVYAVTAVSRHNVFAEGYETAFGCRLAGGVSSMIYGMDQQKIMEYANLDGEDLQETLAVVILNTPAYAGTTIFGFQNAQTQWVNFAIACCPVIDEVNSEMFRRVLVHEAVGHGFAKLEDEYAYEKNGAIPPSKVEYTRELQALGWEQNVDFTESRTEVLWAKFLADERYASDNLGIFKGACTYAEGVYRPTEESMMRSNIQGFNAPSRKAIYDRVMKTGMGKNPTYEEFVTYDLQHRAQTRSISSSIPSKPFAHPQFVGKELPVKKGMPGIHID